MRYPALAMMFLALAAMSCGGTDQGTAAPSMEDAQLDQVMVRNALENEARMEQAGQHLLGRVWFARDGYSALYQDPTSGTITGLFIARSAGDVADPDLVPRDSDTFAGYVARVSGDRTPRYLNVGQTSGLDVALFAAEAPAAASGNVATAAQPLVNQFCPKSDFDILCGGAGWGYGGSRLVANWNVVDRTVSTTFTATGSSYITVLCGDQGDAVLLVTVTSGSKMISIGVVIPQGTWGISMQAGGQTFSEFCHTKFLGVCLDYQCRYAYARPSITISAQPTTGGNYHSCGKIMTRDDVITECQFITEQDAPSIPKFLNPTDCANYCNLSCAKSCRGVAGPALGACMQACGSSCGRSCQ